MTYTTYDGKNFTAIKNDPSLAFTGDMAISLWMRPTDNTTWHQILGKGSISGGTTENDNYQLFQVGNNLVFEWDDSATGNHYQTITTSSTLAAGAWNYVTVSVSGGTIKIYNNGVEQQPLVYNNGLDPTNTATRIPTAPTIILQSTTNDVTMGKQNAPGSEYYYQGDIGALSLYNRGLTTTEIANNLAGYTA
ncbi:MAG: LamG domain-containing protein [Methanoregula sp.]|jgi:hypothetical protein